MKEPANINTTTVQPTPTATVYGMPAYADRAAAVGEVHARPHLLIQAPRGILQLAFMTEGDQAKDQMAMSELSHRFGVAEPDHATPLHGVTWDEGDLHCEKHTEFSTYLWCASLDSETGEPCGENPFRHGFVPPGPVVSGIRLRLLPWTPETEKEADRFDPASLCYSLVENGSAAILTDFRQDEDGLTQILILARDLTPARAGALAQRLTAGQGARVVFDPVGGPSFEPLTQSMARGGILLEYGALSSEPTPFPLFTVLGKSLTLKGYLYAEIVADPEALERAKAFILQGLKSGALRPIIAKTFTLSDIQDAHRFLEANQQIGKIVVTV